MIVDIVSRVSLGDPSVRSRLKEETATRISSDASGTVSLVPPVAGLTIRFPNVSPIRTVLIAVLGSTDANGVVQVCLGTLVLGFVMLIVLSE